MMNETEYALGLSEAAGIDLDATIERGEVQASNSQRGQGYGSNPLLQLDDDDDGPVIEEVFD